jgi:hypothetical protein
MASTRIKKIRLFTTKKIKCEVAPFLEMTGVAQKPRIHGQNSNWPEADQEIIPSSTRKISFVLKI